MAIYTITVKLKSSTLIGSGRGFGANIDTDVVLDSLGAPCLPVKRLKGCLRESIQEMMEMLAQAQVPFEIAPGILLSSGSIDKTFGKPGEKRSASVYFYDLNISRENRIWLEYLLNQYRETISPEAITEFFTELRQQTAIDEKTGVAERNSLRTIRVLKEGLELSGKIETFEDAEPEASVVLALACKNLRHLGTKRNRGFGQVECKLYNHEKQDLTADILQKLEASCKG